MDPFSFAVPDAPRPSFVAPPRRPSCVTTAPPLSALMALHQHQMAHQQQQQQQQQQAQPQQQNQQDQQQQQSGRASSFGREMDQIGPSSASAIARSHMLAPVLELRQPVAAANTSNTPAASASQKIQQRRRQRQENDDEDDEDEENNHNDPPTERTSLTIASGTSNDKNKKELVIRCRGGAEGHEMKPMQPPPPVLLVVICNFCARRGRATWPNDYAGWQQCDECKAGLCSTCVEELSQDPRYFSKLEDWVELSRQRRLEEEEEEKAKELKNQSKKANSGKK